MPSSLRSTSTALLLGLLLVGGCSVYDTSMLLDAPADGAQGGESGASGSGGESGSGAGGEAAGDGGTAGSGEAGSGSSTAGSAGSGDGEPTCQSDADCDDDNPCTKDTCSGACAHINDDALVPPQTKGDCKAEICSSGEIVLVNSDSDVADDGDPCTTERCEGGDPAASEPAADGTACSFAEAAGTCKGGVCIAPCTTNAQCNDSNPCTIDICGSNGLCASSVVDDNQPALDDVDVPGDCQAQICIDGQMQTVTSSTDLPTSNDTCTIASCAGTQPTLTPASDGTACALNGASSCVSGACTCGNGTRESAEACDGSQLGSHSCSELGYVKAAGMTCNSDCTLNTSGCKAACGNGVIEPGEECDDDLSKGAPGDGCSKYCRIEPGVGDLVINEIMFDPEVGQEGSIEHGEYVELYNASARAFDLRGLRLSNLTAFAIIDAPEPIVLAPGGYAVLIRTADPAKNGGITNAAFAWGTSLTLVNSTATTLSISVPSTPTALDIDKATYPGSTTYKGKSYSLDPAKQNAVENDLAANWCAAKKPFVEGSALDWGTPGKPNDPCH